VSCLLAVGFPLVEIVAFDDDSLTRRASYDSVRVQAIASDPRWYAELNHT
jgi:hypothetical protein